MNTRKYARTMAEAFGPYTSNQLEPEQGAIEANEWPLTAALLALVVVAGFAMFVF